jgi:hypothetical protein
VADQPAGELPAAAGPAGGAVPADAAVAPDDGAAVPAEDAAGDRPAGASVAADTSPVEGVPPT